MWALTPPWGRKGSAAALALGILGIALICGVTSARWVGTVFPGFFVMANRVVASVSLPHWPVSLRSPIYQHAVIAVNGQSVATSDELYALVRRFPANAPLTYTLQRDGQVSQVTLSSLTFTLKDYCLFFVAYLFTGLAIALIGIGVWGLTSATPASWALCIASVMGGLFSLTAADLYSPHWFFRVHVLLEAGFPAGLVHLALVFPIDRLSRYRLVFLSVPYLVALALGAAYEVFLYQPALYSSIHNLCMVYAGVAGLTLLLKMVWDYAVTDSYLIRQRIHIVLLAFLSGYALPTLLMFSSGVTGGEVAVNYAAFTGFLFPLGLGYAVVKHDLFEIDAVLKRWVYYLTLTVLLSLTYIALLVLFNFTLFSADLTRSPLFLLLFALVVAFLLNPLKDYVQRGIDRIFFHLQYDPQKVLAATSASLVSTLRLDEILSLTWRTITETLGAKQGGILLRSSDHEWYILVHPQGENGYRLAVRHALIQRLQQKGRVLSRYDLIDEGRPSAGQKESRAELERLGAQLLVPLSFKGDLIGVIAVGDKASGAFFSADDGHFLSTLANQGALSIANALAYQEIQELNANLEQKVEERTREARHISTLAQEYAAELEQAYDDLQHSQTRLVRAERMAALGQLAAGIAHEMSTPLGAALTSLKLLQELLEEYQASIGNPEVTEQEYQKIAAEMDKLFRPTQQWVEKAAKYVRSLRFHTRDLKLGEERIFSVLQVIEDVRLLLAHQLRLSQCTLNIFHSSAEPLLYGDPSKLGQVLTNLVVNAVEAYKDAGREGGEIRVHIRESGHALELQVCDQGCGIPRENLERIFDEFFSTKALGEGTGLGLSIARDIVTNYFGGTIRAESVPGQGSVFTLQLPRTGSSKGQRSIAAEQAA